MRSQQCLPSAEADSKTEINGLDAGLEASSTRNVLAFEFFSSLFSRRWAGAPEEARVFWRNRTPSFRLGLKKSRNAWGDASRCVTALLIRCAHSSACRRLKPTQRRKLTAWTLA